MDARSHFSVGQVVDGRYELRRVIGWGAEGVVFEAHQKYLDRPVALKTIVTEGRETSLAKRRKRLLREAHVLSELRHPGIVTVLDAGATSEGHPYFAMELLDGKTLDAVVAARGKLSAADTLPVLIQLCDTIAFAHKRGVLHRDIKPSNVVIVRQVAGGERTKLLDFGTSKAGQVVDTKLTEDGAIIGTPAYMSPEQLMGATDLDVRTDVYALGALAYECLTGRCVYPGNYPSVVRAAYSPEPVPPMRVPGVDAGLEAVIVKALAKDRTQRHPTIEAFAEALRPFVQDGAEIHLVQSNAQMGRRRHERAPFIAPVGLRGPEGAVDGRCEDISESGMLFLSRSECVEERVYELRFGAPVSGRVVVCKARARWVRVRANGGWAVGLEFVDLPRDAVADVALFVRLMNQPPHITVETEPDSVSEPCNVPSSAKMTSLETPQARRT